MSTLSNAFPPALRSWIKKQVRERGFSDEAEFIRDLVRREKERYHEQQFVESKLHEAIASGESTPFSEADWQQIEQQGVTRLAKRKK